jgi:mycofactocin biosynthesis protein MftB
MGFDPSRPYRLHPQVALRPEAFGALAYHFGNRRLLFVKSQALVELLQGLAAHPSAAAALDAVGIDVAARARWERVLARMEASEVICAR